MSWFTYRGAGNHTPRRRLARAISALTLPSRIWPRPGETAAPETAIAAWTVASLRLKLPSDERKSSVRHQPTSPPPTKSRANVNGQAWTSPGQWWVS